MNGYVDGKPIKLGALLGEGHFKIVYADGDPQSQFVYAMFKPVTDPQEAQLNALKVAAACKVNFPADLFFGPEKPITKEKNGGEILGFRAYRYPSDAIIFQLLTDASTWNMLQLNQSHVTKALLGLSKDVVLNVHKRNALIGDFSAANAAFRSSNYKGIGYDIDAYQFVVNGQILPCTQGTPEFITPSLMRGDHELSVADDLWSLAIIAGQSLLRVYPFREGDTGQPDLSSRITNGLHVLNPDLRYPPTRVANPVTSLPNRTIGFLKSVYDAAECNVTLDQFITEFEWLDSQWKTCDKHPYPLVYAKERAECPHCLKDRSVPTITIVIVGAGVKFVLVFEPTFPKVVLYSKATVLDGEAVFFEIRNLGNKIQFQWIDQAGKVVKQFTTVEPIQQNTVFDVNPSFVMVANGDDINLYSVGSEKLEHTLKTQQYQNRPLAALGKETPLLLAGVNLSRGKLVFGKMYPDIVMHLASSNSVWFTASQYRDVARSGDIVVGFTNLWNSYQWFVHMGVFTLLPNVKTEVGEFMQDWQVIFDGKGYALIRRMVAKSGQAITRVDVFEGSSLIFSTELPEKVQGRAALSIAKGSIFIPTEEGIRKVTKDSSTILSGSENVSPASQLVILGGNLFVIDELTGQIARVSANK
jgi:hypothetical protein